MFSYSLLVLTLRIFERLPLYDLPNIVVVRILPEAILDLHLGAEHGHAALMPQQISDGHLGLGLVSPRILWPVATHRVTIAQQLPTQICLIYSET